jgi:chemosensory pili system protein ChpA (sensor histidine kinase/response regulator)
MNDMAAQSLDLVSHELTATLEAARARLEDYVDGHGGRDSLNHCADLLHLAGGALRIVEAHGAALLAEEMEDASRFLITAKDPELPDRGGESLTRAMVQLPAYIERLLSGGRDVALVLLPLLNELRDISSKPSLSEGTLVLLSSGPQGRFVSAPSKAALATTPPTDKKGLAALRPAFQTALLGWIRSEQSAKHLRQLIRISRELEKMVVSEPARQIWYVLTGVLEALAEDGLEETVSLKRLVGQADRQLKRLIAEGEGSFVQAPPVDLLNGLLYYISRASGNRARVEEIRSVYSLDEVVPPEEQLVEARNELAGPSAKLMRTVAQAIKEDLSSVKDALDIFVRTGMEDPEDLAQQLDMLKKIGDTLGVLGLGALRDQIRAQAKGLGAIVAAESTMDESALERMAATLLDVEDILDRELVRAVAPSMGVKDSEEIEDKAHYRQVTKAVLSECIVNLSHVKEAVTQLLAHPENVRLLDQVEPQLRGITAGLLMLGKSRAVSVAERIGAIIKERLAPGESLMRAELLERLADAIVSIEYYMETVGAGRKDPWYMLDNAERCLGVLERTLAAAPRHVEKTPERREEVAAEVAREQAAKRTRRPAVMQQSEDRLDPELVELFIEEAKEEIAAIRRNLPAWRENLGNDEPLIAIRRAFHTLKGSGRMVGAELIGEFCWSVEKILNRVINKTLQATEPMLEFLQTATNVLPRLVEQLEFGTTPQVDVTQLMRHADNFVEADAESIVANETFLMPVLDGPVFAEHAQAPEKAAPTIDPVLAEIFVKEARGHLEVIRDFLASVELDEGPYAVEEPLYRACHTLLGSAKMAAYQPIINVVEPLSQYVGQKYQLGGGMDEPALQTLQQTLLAMQRMTEALASNEGFDDDLSDLIARLAGLEVEVDREQAEQQKPVEAEDDDVREFDPEIAAIFSEEATEILDNAELALQEFRRDSSQVSELAELQRLLHTLKGGARMAGIDAMGNLSHALEDLLAGLTNGRLVPSAEAIDVVQQSLDRLHSMRDAIGSGRYLEQPRELLGQIAALAQAETVAESRARDERRSIPTLEQVFAEDSKKALEEPLEPLEPLEERLEERAAEPEQEIFEPAPERDLTVLTLTPDDLAHFDEPSDEEQIELAEAAQSPETPAVAALPEEPAEAAASEPVAALAASATELVRVDAELLDALLNGIGEVSIFQSRLNQQAQYIDFHLGELDQTVVRLRDQLRKLEAETEAQILHRHQDEAEARGDFDPLELDRYSSIQQLSRALAETANDVASLNDLLRGLANETSTLLTQQARITASVQGGLMQTRMVPFQRYVPRLARIVRQACADTGKLAQLAIEGAQGELDRQVIERMLGPLEHLLRNAVVHGIETPDARRAKHKPDVGRVALKLKREGSEVIIEVADDGAGLNLARIRRKAEELGLLSGGPEISDAEAAELILKPGFTTADELTHAAGRGVGMDVVDNQVKKLGGSLRIESTPNAGARFVLRLPYTLAITHALIVNIGEETFALPLPTVEGVTRVPKDRLLELLTEDDPRIEHGSVSYRLQHLGSFVGASPSSLPDEENSVPLVLVRAGESSTALLTDSLEGSREVVVKTLGPHISGIPGISGATILGDGRIIIILDAITLIRNQKESAAPVRAVEPVPEPRQLTALVVDDSITMRRVTQRLLERRGIKVLTARDGMDAVTVLQDHEPDIILLDIEMPRMDGYQFATHVRNDPKAKDIPIIMITSRSGEKHRARAIEIGVNDYLSKPYQEDQLIGAVGALLGREL